MPRQKEQPHPIPFPYHATILSGRKNPHPNPFSFRRNKNIRNFHPDLITVPFTLDLVRLSQQREILAEEARFEVVEIIGVYARQLAELHYGTVSNHSEPIEAPTIDQHKIVVSAGVIGHLTLHGAEGDNNQQLYSAVVTNYRSYHADDYLFVIEPPRPGYSSLAQPFEL